MKNLTKIKNLEKWAYVLVVLGVAALVLYVVKIYLKGYTLFSNMNSLDVEVTGQFGDFFGGVVGSLWALAGVLLYFSALKLQQEQLREQKRDIKLNEKLVSQQQFESTFFGLLQTQKDLKNDLSCQVERIVWEKNNYYIKKLNSNSASFFHSILNELYLLYLVYKRESYEIWDEETINIMISQLNSEADFYEENGIPYDYSSKIKDLLEYLNLNYFTKIYHVKESTVKLAQKKDTEELICCSIYGHVFLTYQDQLGHYFRHLYNIVKFLDNEKQKSIELVKDEQNFIQLEIDINRRFSNYFSFVHSMLSTSELAVLYYNSMLFPKAKELYIKYGMFNNLLDSNLINKEHSELIKDANLKNKKELFQEIIDRLVNEN